jgi:hypothetical protein
MRRLVVVLALALLACGGQETWETRIAPALDASAARARAVSLAPTHAPLSPARTTPMTRVLVNGDAVVLDVAPNAANVPHDLSPALFADFLPPPPLELGSVRDGVLALTPGEDSRVGAALEGARLRRAELREVAILAEAGTPAVVLAELLTVLAEVGTVRAELFFQGPDGPVSTFVSARSRDELVPESDQLELQLLRVDGGFSVRGSGGPLAPGCGSVLPWDTTTLTIPDTDAIDGPAIGRCMDVVAVAFPDQTLHVVSERLTVDDLAVVLGGIATNRPPLDVVLVSHAIPRPEPHMGVMERVLAGEAVPAELESVVAPGS